jgi:TPP-dependent pyruvate/acetoin dehydrogenase alpha subunit
LVDEGAMTADEQSQLRGEIQTAVDTAAESAALAPVATLEEIETYVYAP